MPRVFVFGALMCSAPGRTGGRAATVLDHEVRFVAKGIPYFEPAFAALVPASGGRAHGVLYEFSDEEWARLREREPGYVEVEVVAQSGDEVLNAVALAISEEERLPEPGAPSRRYVRILLHGAREHDLPEQWVARLLELEKSGPSFTSHCSYLIQTVRFLIPYVGVNGAILAVLLGLAALFVLVFALLF